MWKVCFDFFGEKKRWGRAPVTLCAHFQVDSSRSARSGVTPSLPSKAVPAEMRDAAKARLQETASIRVHRRLQARNVDRCNTGCASRLRAAAMSATKSKAELLHRPLPIVSRFQKTMDGLDKFVAFVSKTGQIRTCPSKHIPIQNVDCCEVACALCIPLSIFFCSLCEVGGVVQGDEGPVCGVAQVIGLVCHCHHEEELCDQFS